MSVEIQRFEFAEFYLDAEEKILMRDGQTVSMTPKAFQLLFVLIKNQGRPVKKSELMREVWADSFVEDGNLTFTVNLLRRTLGDDRNNPRFIETIPKYGYRFIAEVKEINKTKTVNSTDLGGNLKSRRFFIASALVLLVSTIVLGFWYQQKRKSEINVPILVQSFVSDKLSFNGKTPQAVISPDGKNVFYVTEINGKQSVWLRQLEISSHVEIIPPSNDLYLGLKVSPDGSFLYFIRSERNSEKQADIYRVPILGGIPQKIVNQVQGWMSVSPDGTKISFVRCPRNNEELCSLWIADSVDGKNEKKLVSRPDPIRLGANQISADGKTIVFAVGQSENIANEFGLNEVEIDSGQERQLTREKFFNIRHLVQLPDDRGWLITAKKSTQRNFSINLITSTGESVSLTKDSETYSELSLDKNGSSLVSTQIKAVSSVTIFQTDDPSKSRILEGLANSRFAPDGKLVFTSEMSGNNDIWSVNQNGDSQYQLTNDPSDDSSPVVSPDNSRVFFMSNRSGEAQVWEIKSDGGDQKQITQKEGGFPVFVSPDGLWVYYVNGMNRTLWRVSLKDSEEQQVLDIAKNEFACSPDGTKVAFIDGENLAIASLPTGKIVKKLPLADEKAGLQQIAWLPDGKKLIYSLEDRKNGNYILWQQSLEGEKPRRFVELDNSDIQDIAVSPDGKYIAVAQRRWLHDAVLLKGLR